MPPELNDVVPCVVGGYTWWPYNFTPSHLCHEGLSTACLNALLLIVCVNSRHHNNCTICVYEKEQVNRTDIHKVVLSNQEGDSDLLFNL